MAEKRFYWLKLSEDFFKSRDIKKLRKIAGGDTYTIIYLKLLLLSLTDNGYLYYEGVEPTFAEEMALAIDEDEENVEVTLNYLEQRGLLERKTLDEYILTECAEMTGSETSVARRVRKTREKKALLEKEKCYNVTLECKNETNCNTDETNCNTEIDIDKEKDKDKEKEQDLDLETEKILKIYAKTKLPKLNFISDELKTKIKNSLQQFIIEDFELCFKKAENSLFLTGKNNLGWKANLEWLLKNDNMAKVLNGNYDNRPKNELENQPSYNLEKVKQNAVNNTDIF